MSPLAARVGESSVNLRAGEKLTVRDLAIAALVPSANDAATALAAYVGRGSIARFVAMMNAKASELGLTSTHFENPHGLDQPGHVSSARDMTTLLTAALRNPFIRTWSTRSTATIAGGRTLTSTDDLIGTLPLIGAKTGHTNDAGWSQVAAVQGDGVRITASVLGSPTRGAAERRSRRAARLGARAVPPGAGDRRRRVYGARRDRLRAAAVRLVARDDGRPDGARGQAARRACRRAARRCRCRSPAGQRVGEVRVYAGGRLIARTPLVAAESVSAVGTAGKVAGTPGALSTISSGSSRSVHVSEGVTRVIVTVTLNAALDRSLTVPIFKLGHRHRASNVLALAGGKGINVARALKRLDVPVVATGLAGGRTGTRIVEELTEEAILNDFVRIRDESRTSTAVVDPTSGTYTEINEWGPKVVRWRSSRSCSTSCATSPAARRRSCSPARCRAASTRASTPTRCAR